MSDRTQKALQLLSKPDITDKQLTNLLDNVKDEGQISESDRELLIDAIAQKLRQTNPARAKALFGAKGTEAIEILTRAHNFIKSKYDLSQNSLKNGVKTGGDMINGDAYISHYLSYKNKEQWGCVISYFQETLETLPVLRVKRYRTGKNQRLAPEESNFPIALYDEALALYESYLLESLQQS